MIFGRIAAEEICKQTTYFFSYNIRFTYEYYAIEKQDILYSINMSSLRLTLLPDGLSLWQVHRSGTHCQSI